MPDKMKFAVLTKAKNAEIHERRIPELKEDEVLVKQDICYICTTDYGQWLGLREHQGYPMAGGHEVSGTIVKKGIKVGDTYEIGDRVAYGYYYCGNCEACKSGDTDLCKEKMAAVSPDGYRGNFGFSDYAVKNVKMLVKIDQSVSPEAAAFLEPLATVIDGIERLRIKLMETVVILGAGTMGILNAQVARAYGANVIVADILDKKIECAKEMGFKTINSRDTDVVEAVKEMNNGKPADAVIVAVGNAVANQQALDILKPSEGKILFFAAGYPAPELKIDSNVIHYRKLELIGAYEATAKDFLMAAKMLEQEKVDVSPIIEDKFALEDVQDAYKKASMPGMYRVGLLLN